jgi:DNA-directed RNA polymerase specialized sigma24 family protein
VLQETFLAVWKNAGSYQARGQAGGLWVIARNQAALLLRRRGQLAERLTNEAAGQAADGDPAAAVPALTLRGARTRLADNERDPIRRLTQVSRS